MTTLEIPDVEAETRRDQYGRYLIVPPGGTKPIGYTRATTVAKTFDGEGGLLPWKATMAMTGMMRRPGLRAKFEALLARFPERGPWYGNEQSKEQCKRLVEECAEAGGSADRADIGMALHSIIEQMNKGATPSLSQDVTTADIEAYQTTMADAGLVVDPHYCEATVAVDRWRVAGMSDMLRITVPHEGDVVGDLKTGETLEWSWQPMCVQLAIYANGDNIYRQGPAPDGSGDVREAMPKVSRQRGLIIHLPAGKAACTLHWVDLAAGWEAFERSMWAREWRARRDLHTLFAPRRPTPTARHPLPDEGATVAAADVEAMRRAFVKLPDGAQAWATATMIQGNDGVLAWNRLSAVPTMRRYELYRGVGILAKWAEPAGADDPDLDETVRAIVALVADDVSALFPTNPPGLLLGMLDAGRAARFAEIAVSLANDHYALVTDPTSGLLQLTKH